MSPAPGDRPPIPILDAESPAAAAVALAALRQGRLVVIATETVYGLAADARHAEAVARVYAVKGRPGHNPLIVHVADVEAARRLAHLDARAEALAARFWPGPLTLVLPRRQGAGLAAAVTAGLPTLALRVPAAPALLALLRAGDVALAAPSANVSGRLSPTDAAAAAAEVAHAPDVVACVLDGGPCALGLESTIIGLAAAPGADAAAGAFGPATLLRPGALAAEAIADVIGPLAAPAADGVAIAPGMTLRHYAPRRPLRLDAAAARPGEALLAFGPAAPAEAFANLSAAGDIAEAAAALFRALRAADEAPGYQAIAVAPIPTHGVGAAIADRLRRAAAAAGSPEAPVSAEAPPDVTASGAAERTPSPLDPS